MQQAHLFDSNSVDWIESRQFPGLWIKPLETHATHPSARVTLVRLPVGGVIDTHVHDVETETIFVLGGHGVLQLGEDEAVVAPGTGGSVPPGMYHSLRNSGD